MTVRQIEPDMRFTAGMTFDDMRDLFKKKNLPAYLKDSDFGSIEGKVAVVTGANSKFDNI